MTKWTGWIWGKQSYSRNVAESRKFERKANLRGESGWEAPDATSESIRKQENKGVNQTSGVGG